MSRFSITLFIIVLSQYTYAFNQSQFDSLYNLAKKEKSISIGKDALAIAIELKNNGLIAKSYYLIAFYQHKKGMYYNTLNNYLEALSYYRLDQNITRQTSVLKNIGSIYFRAKFFDRALVFYNDALELASINEDYRQMGLLHYDIGVLLRQSGELSQSINSFDDAEVFFDQQNNQAMLADLRAERYLIAIEQENYSLAFTYYKDSTEFLLSDSSQIFYERARRLNNLGYLYLKMGRLRYSQRLFVQGLEVAQKQNKRREIFYDLYGNLSKISELENDTLVSISMQERAFDFMKLTDFEPQFLGTAKLLSDYYDEKNDVKRKKYDNAIFEYAEALNLLQGQLKQTDIHYQVEAATYKKESKVRFEAHIRQQKITLWSYITIFLIVGAVVFYFCYRFYRLRKEAKKILGL